MTFKTVEQMKDEIKELKGEKLKAFVAGMLAERGLIVEWLRGSYQSDDDNWGIYFANEIEAGEHLN